MKVTWLYNPECYTYKGRDNKHIVNINAPPQCPLGDQSSENCQCGRNQQNPSNDIEEGADILTGSRLSWNGMVRRYKERRHRIVFIK